MLELELLPGRGLGPFALGSSVEKVLGYLRENERQYPCVEVKVLGEDEQVREGAEG